MGMSLKILGIWCVVAFVTFMLGVDEQDGDWMPFILWLLVSAPVYVASLYLHPRRACWSCEGTGKHTGFVFDYANRACTNCDGSGRRPRLGARLLHIDAS